MQWREWCRRPTVEAIVTVVVFLLLPLAVNAAESDNVTGWAWNAEAGWISINATNCRALNQDAGPDPCTLGGHDYGITIARNGTVSGYAWSRTAGWMCVGATCAGSGGATPAGGWRARVDAITGQLTGWGKFSGLGDGGWASFSCENTNTCGTVAYRSAVNVATGAWSGYAWNGAREGVGAGSALGWIAWAPQFGGVTTTWRPEPLCSVTERSCRSDIECGLPGEYCCLGGAPCGRCGGDGAVCGSSATCGVGVLCCREGVRCGQCTADGAACGADANCPDQARDSCCPSGAVCTGGRGDGTDERGGGGCDNNGSCGAGETAENCPLDCGAGDRGSVCDGDGDCEAGESVVNCGSDCGAGGGGGTCNANGVCEVGESAVGCPGDCGGAGTTTVIGLCQGDTAHPAPCVGDEQCGSQSCEFDRGICGDTAGGSAGNACGQGGAQSGCGAEDCRYDFGIRADVPGRAEPCATASEYCRRVIGKCTNAEQLCVANTNCPVIEEIPGQCGKLFLPWLQTQFGSVYSSMNVGSAMTAPPPSGQYNATYCILAGGSIVNFVSAPGGCGSAAQPQIQPQRTLYPKEGEALALPKSPNYVSPVARLDIAGILAGRYGRPTQTMPTLAELTSANGFTLGGRIFRYVGAGDLRLGAIGKTIRFNNAVGNASGAGLFVIKGRDLYIDSDIVYSGGQAANIRNLASPGFLVFQDIAQDARGNQVKTGGNIFVDPGVRSLAGAFYAESEIHTGSTGRAATEQPLVVAGVMVAKKFLFERLYAGAQPAEQVIADGRIIANPPPGLSDLTKSLPTITQTIP